MKKLLLMKWNNGRININRFRMNQMLSENQKKIDLDIKDPKALIKISKPILTLKVFLSSISKSKKIKNKMMI